MGLGDRIRDAATGFRDHEYTGFDPDVCVGCPLRGDGVCGFCGQEDCNHEPCGLCGCPTVSGFPMDQLGAPPEDCRRLEQHRRS